MEFFSSYKEAHDALDLPGSWQQGTIGTKEQGLTSIKLTANPKSLDRISQDLQTIYYVGKGKKASPGEPVKAQRFQDQQYFLKSIETANPVTVLTKLKTGVVVALGLYKVVSVRLVPLYQHIQYYQVKLVAVHKR
jgi:hypothetical protein